MFETRLYIQISAERLRISSPQIIRSYESIPVVAIEAVKGKKIVAGIGADAEMLRNKPNMTFVNPFGHPRLVLGDFTVGEKLLCHAVRSILKGKWFTPMLLGIVHPERQLEGGLTQIEYRALRELCVNAGCRKVAVHEGRVLTVDEVRTYDVRA